MSSETVTFRIASEKRRAIDELAEKLKRDRSDVLNAALDAYLELHDWQMAHIDEGLRQADAGEFASDEEVAKAFAR